MSSQIFKNAFKHLRRHHRRKQRHPRRIRGGLGGESYYALNLNQIGYVPMIGFVRPQTAHSLTNFLHQKEESQEEENPSTQTKDKPVWKDPTKYDELPDYGTENNQTPGYDPKHPEEYDKHHHLKNQDKQNNQQSEGSGEGKETTADPTTEEEEGGITTQTIETTEEKERTPAPELPTDSSGNGVGGSTTQTIEEKQRESIASLTQADPNETVYYDPFGNKVTINGELMTSDPTQWTKKPIKNNGGGRRSLAAVPFTTLPTTLS
jgi:hypothetical protein